MTTLFISDLHLAPERPTITALFLDLLRRRAADAEALYILGDLFEAWIGDDDDSELGHEVGNGLATLSARGVPVFFIHGNRDFLLGRRFAERSGLELLPEVQVIDLYGTQTIIMHGDTLCTDDLAYQALRARVRAPEWQFQVLALPIAQRHEMAKQLRLDSERAMREKPEDIMDVNPGEVLRTMRTYGVHQLIHGHTHRPASHDFNIDGKPARRIVLGDWYEQGNVLSCDHSGCQLEFLSPLHC